MTVAGAGGAAWALGRGARVEAAQDPCGPELLRRVRVVTMLSSDDAATLQRGDAVYRENLRGKATGEPVRAQLRGERKYLGPVPTAVQLKCLVDRGAADAFYPLLATDFRKQLTDELRSLEATIGRTCCALDVETDAALAAARGTPDEVILELSQPGARARQGEMVKRSNRADKKKERFINQTTDKGQTWWCIRQEKWPQVFELQRTLEETLELRRQFLEVRVREILERSGLAALDATAFDRGVARR